FAGGFLTEPRWIYVASLPTVIWMVRLERWTRRAADQPKPETSPIACGAIVTGAALGAIAIMVGLAMRFEHHQPHPGVEVALKALVAGLGPSLALGAGLGWIARQLASTSRHLRRFALCAPVVAVIALLGAATEEWLVAPALVPAIAAMLLLERVT